MSRCLAYGGLLPHHPALYVIGFMTEFELVFYQLVIILSFKLVVLIALNSTKESVSTNATDKLIRALNSNDILYSFILLMISGLFAINSTTFYDKCD